MSDHHNTNPTTPPITDPEASPADSSIDEVSTDTESTGSEDPGSEVDQSPDTARLPGKRSDDVERAGIPPARGVPN
jgi:hypothetical protein